MDLALKVGALGMTGLVVLAAFIGARATAAAVLKVGGRLRPFGELRLSSAAGAGLGRRLVIAAAGLLAIYVALVLLLALGHALDGGGFGRPTVEVIPSSPAARAGMQDGDRLLSVGGVVADSNAIRRHLAADPQSPVPLLLERAGKRLELSVVPEGGKLGVRLKPSPPAAGDAVRAGMRAPFEVWTALADAVRPGPGELAGPVGVAAEMRGSSGAVLAMALSVASRTPPLFAISLALLLAVRTPAASAPSRGRPIVRFLARLVDASLIALPLAIARDVLGPGVALFIAFLAIPAEAAMLSTWGYTPGKWLLSISVRGASGEKLGFAGAVHRAGAVTLYGLGASLDFGLVTGVLSYRRLRRTGATYWDDLGGWQISHGRVGLLRIGLLCLVLLAVFASAVVPVLDLAGT